MDGMTRHAFVLNTWYGTVCCGMKRDGMVFLWCCFV